MCNCIDVELGSYKAHVIVADPFTGKQVGIDACVLDEIKSLWDEGIQTCASCCGHNKVDGTIAVMPECEEEMVKMGYEMDFRHDYPYCFYPKSVDRIKAISSTMK